MTNPVLLTGKSHGQSRLNAGSQKHQILISGTFSLSHLGKGLCTVIILRILRWRDYPGYLCGS